MIPVSGEKYWYAPKQLLITFIRQRETKFDFSCGKRGKDSIILTATGLDLLTAPTEEQAALARVNPERVAKMIEKIGGIEPEAVPEGVLQSLQAVRSAIRIRFSWPPAADIAVRERFNQLGIYLPKNARPMNSGINGGTPMYSLSSEIHYPKGLGLSSEYGTEDTGGEMYVSRVSLALALAQKGFDINVATL